MTTAIKTYEQIKDEGRLEERQQAILTVLHTRGMIVTATARTAIERCDDPAQLARWLTAAVTASSMDDIFHAET